MASGRNTIKQKIALDGGKAIQEELKALGQAGEKAFNDIRKSALAADLAKFGDGLNRLGKDLATVGRRFAIAFGAIAAAGTAAGIAVTKLAKDGSEAADEMGKLAQSAGLTIEQFGKLSFAAEQSGVSQEEFVSGFARFNRVIAEAASGNKNAAAAFAQLGVRIKDANGQIRPAEEIIADMVAAFSRMPDGVKKSALAMEFFGKLGAKLIPFLNLSRDGLRALFEEFEKSGLGFTQQQFKIAEAFNDTLDVLQRTANGIRLQLGLLFAPALTQGAQLLIDAIRGQREAILGFANDLVARAVPLIEDFFAVLSGRDQDVENIWILEWRDAIVQFGASVVEAVQKVIIPAFEALRRTLDIISEALKAVFGVDISGSALGIVLVVGTLTGSFRALNTAIRLAFQALALLARNPVVAAIALIAGDIALWALRADEATKALEQHRNVVGTLQGAYEAVGRVVANITKEVRDRLTLETLDSLETTQKALSAELEKIRNEIKQFDGLLPKDADPIFDVGRQFIEGIISVEQFQAAVDALAVDNPALAKLANQFDKITEKAIELAKGQKADTDWLDLLSGKISDAEFQARQMGESLGTIKAPPEVTKPIDDISAAADAAGAKVEELGRKVTVTKFGGSGGPVQQVFELVDGVARAVEDSKTALDKVGDSAAGATDKLKKTTEEVFGVLRSVPEGLRSQPGIAETITEGLQEATEQVRSAAQTVTDATAPARDAVRGIGDEFTAAGASAQAAFSGVPAAAQQAIDTVVAEAAKIGPALAEIDGDPIVAALVKPFEDAQSAIARIGSGIGRFAESGMNSVLAQVRRLGGEISAMISSIISALRRAASEAARLRSEANSGEGGDGAPGLAAGGQVQGPGSSTSDSILAWLSNGEFVVNAAATRRFLPLLRAINSGRIGTDLLKAVRGFRDGGMAAISEMRMGLPGFSIGGFVDDIGRSMHALVPSPIPMLADGGLPPTRPAGRPVVFQMQDGTQFAAVADDEVAEKMVRYGIRKEISSTGRLPSWFGGGR